MKNAHTTTHPKTIAYTDHKGERITGRLLDTAGDFATYYFPKGMDGDRKADRGWHQVTHNGKWIPDLSTKHRNYALQAMRDLNKKAQG